MNTGMPQQGTIHPGTTIQIGTCIVVINRYLAEGGFAHVYLATLSHEMGSPLVSVPIANPDAHGLVPVAPLPVVVKRIAVPDKERLAIVVKEIDTMKSLGKHKNIVQYYNSCIGKLVGGGYEILILMEYCGGGPVIDLMNKRLQVRLTEPEILKIFSNVCEAVAFLHYSNPPILHRDIKVENILLSGNDYKLCDFGSATTNIFRGDRIPLTSDEIKLLQDEINNYTTLQYRAPEMVDPFIMKQHGIDEKIDIWALGVLLYKLCYYTTPFENDGPLGISNYRSENFIKKVPQPSDYSKGLIDIIASILRENPRDRLNIYQVMMATSALRGLPCPIQNKYPDMPHTLPVSDSQQSITADILTSATVTRPTTDFLPSIEPMRRGRPTRPSTVASAIQQNGVQDAFQTPPSQNGFNHGFDDSFGEFSTTTNSASQFSKFPSAGDAFSFENDVPSQPKRFTLTQATKDDFGFDFSNVGSKDPSPASSASATAPSLAPRPRPPSLGSSDFVQSESLSPTHRTSAMNPSPIQFSGATLSAKNPIADQSLFAPVNTGSQSSGMTKPLLPQQVSQISGQPPLPSRSNATKGLPPGSLGTAAAGSLPKKQEEPSESLHPFERLHRQQMEQLNRFSVASTSAQNGQGKSPALDPSKTLDGMKSLDMNQRMNMMSTGSGVTPGLGSVQPPLAPRPQVAPLASPVAQTGAPPLDRKELARKDLESELRLLEMQQKDFEKQRQDLVASQRRELEEQQQLHRAQQEQLQKRQQNQMQLQHEKWLERNRTMGEEEQLTEQQFQQQRELRKRHDDQQQLLQQQQQQRLPDISNVAASVASISLTTTDRNILAATGQQKRLPHEQSPERSLLPVGTGQQATVIYPSTVLIGSRPTTAVINGGGASTLTPSTASTTSSTSPVMSSSTIGATKARRVSVGNLPTGQKPDPMPKPPRFSMKTGTGTLASGEEEAFSKRFPSIHAEGDLTQHQQRGSMSVQSPSTSQGSNRTTQYMSPSQRARELQYSEEEEEEEERLVRKRNGGHSQSARQTVVDPRQTVVGARQTVVDPRQTVVGARQTVVDPRQTVVSPRQTVVDQRQTIADQRQTVVDQRQTGAGATDETPIYIESVRDRIARAEQMSRMG
ncbi:hypothetical protein BGX34_000134 [Mortierella sp. NVP85]|nr:hypothetical protein BGX34_000134 [Mortierella sp. NVP85]